TANGPFERHVYEFCNLELLCYPKCMELCKVMLLGDFKNIVEYVLDPPKSIIYQCDRALASSIFYKYNPVKTYFMSTIKMSLKLNPRAKLQHRLLA
ncbi:hypothetical protein H5410_019824, partial [Solanum commersonii]